MLAPQTYVRFPSPITLSLRIASSRPRVAAGVVAPRDPVLREFSALPMFLQIDPLRRIIAAYLPPIPQSLRLYGEDDFAAACADTMEDHAGRVLQLLGSDPATALQALIDGRPQSSPAVRVPREIPNWRAKAILQAKGSLSQVEAVFAALDEPQRTVALLAWNGDAKVARRSATIEAIAIALGWTASEVDAMFVAAAAIEI